MKEFYDEWTQGEIDDYLRTCPILVLFRIHTSSSSAEILIYGKLNEAQKFALKSAIVSMFGGNSLSKSACDRINEFAEKWHDRNVKTIKSRVINIKKRAKV
jgi:hypothetical protein